jgi:glycolate oxidase FAD binding subunit
MQAVLEDLAQRIRAAADAGIPLRIRGGGSKDFYGRPVDAEPLEVAPYHGVVEYEPSELVLTVRAGTPLAEVEALLARSNQMLGFEPPHFGPNATVGGCVAAGLSGPRRPYAGSVRDYVLGIRLLDGSGRDLRFGGKVIKNVAGYDVSRLMVGALGTLGVITEISFKVVPMPAAESSLRFELQEADAVSTVNRWSGQPLPISATCWSEGQLVVRLSGAEASVRAAHRKIGGEFMQQAAAFWSSIREQTNPWFRRGVRQWRISVRSVADPLRLPGSQVIEWGGALRWALCDVDGAQVRSAAEDRGGHATLFRGRAEDEDVFHPLKAGLLEIHKRLKRTFDPAGVLNPGRMYSF